MRPPRGPAGRGRPSPCPGRLRPRGRGEAAGDARARVPAAVRSFVELAVAAKLPGESHWFAVGNTQAVVLGALCVNNPVLCVLSACDPV